MKPNCRKNEILAASQLLNGSHQTTVDCAPYIFHFDTQKWRLRPMLATVSGWSTGETKNGLAPIVKNFYRWLSQSITAYGRCLQEKTTVQWPPPINYMMKTKDEEKLDNRRRSNSMWNVYVCMHINAQNALQFWQTTGHKYRNAIPSLPLMF